MVDLASYDCCSLEIKKVAFLDIFIIEKSYYMCFKIDNGKKFCTQDLLLNKKNMIS